MTEAEARALRPGDFVYRVKGHIAELFVQKYLVVAYCGGLWLTEYGIPKISAVGTESVHASEVAAISEYASAIEADAQVARASAERLLACRS